MARMSPSSLKYRKATKTEKDIFLLLQNQLNNEYTVIHSIPWYYSAREIKEIEKKENIDVKYNGEADFIIIHPNKGIIILEVKGGDIKYSSEKGCWMQNNKKLKKSPLKQVEDNRYKISERINQKLSKCFNTLPKIKYCFALAFPECEYQSSFIYSEFPKERIHFVRELCLDNQVYSSQDINTWIEGVFSFFEGQQSESLEKWIDAIVEFMNGSVNFSSTLQAQMAVMNYNIKSLTDEQIKFFECFKENARLRIQGCAGSGKTLVAAEQAIRLNNEGIKTLILCHSKYLAEYMRNLTRGHDKIFVEDFCSWIARLKNDSPDIIYSWNHYEEPTEDDLIEAHSNLIDSQERYDAIIVDEGQDFRDNWWEIVEEALVDKENGKFYIFHDDNQALRFGQASKYPIKDLKIYFGKNCRNAGKIFELVRSLHEQAPETSIYLQDRGIYVKVETNFENTIFEFKNAVNSIVKSLSTNQIVVLTTEHEPIEKSILNGLEVELIPYWKWQDVVLNYFNLISRKARHYNDKLSQYISSLRHSFSQNLLPIQNDIMEVVQLATRIWHEIYGHVPPRESRLQWIATNETLYIPGASNAQELIAFFCSNNWAKSIPKIKKVRLTANKQLKNGEEIFLSTVASFKGLESDGVILCVFPQRNEEDLKANLYVGVSRAKFVLYIVGDFTTLSHFLPQIEVGSTF